MITSLNTDRNVPGSIPKYLFFSGSDNLLRPLVHFLKSEVKDHPARLRMVSKSIPLTVFGITAVKYMYSVSHIGYLVCIQLSKSYDVVC